MWFSDTHCNARLCRPEVDFAWYAIFYNGSLLSVPLFYFCAGMTLAINLNQHGRRRIAARAFQIIAVGYALTFFVMGPQQWLHAYVLQSIGFGLLLMAASSRWRLGPHIVASLALAATLYKRAGRPYLSRISLATVRAPSIGRRGARVNGLRCLSGVAVERFHRRWIRHFPILPGPQLRLAVSASRPYPLVPGRHR